MQNNSVAMFFTWTTYGTWLPGDERGHAEQAAFAVTGDTAAELVLKRADASAVNVNLTRWGRSRVHKQDVITA